MGFFAVINAYTMRSCLNISIIELVYKAASNSTSQDDTCEKPNETYTPERDGFMWSEELQGIILGAFFCKTQSFL